MIALATSVPPSPAKGVCTPPAGSATGDFSDTLAGLTDAPAPVKSKFSPSLPTGAFKPGAPDVSRLADPETPVTLSAFLDSSAGESTGDAVPAMPGAKGQDVAADGKALPSTSPDDDASKDVVWLPTALMQPIPLPVSRPLGLPKFGNPVAPAGGEIAPVPQAGPSVETPPVLTTPTPIAPDVLIAGDGGSPVRQPPTPADAPVVAPPEIGTSDTPVRAGPAVPVVAPSAQPQAPVAQPAAQAFAAAIASAVQQARREEREPADQRTPMAIAATALEALHAHAVTATANARQSALDLKQDSGLQGMIDHIETLRDGADANDTRIRLVPDALGTVDVSVRKQGDRVHVHFAAENQASARLLGDAQPRLAELAEARGVKLGQTSVDSGQGQNQARQRQSDPILSTRPASAIAAGILETTDSRIA